jgi:hypothetical protein
MSANFQVYDVRDPTRRAPGDFDLPLMSRTDGRGGRSALVAARERGLIAVNVADPAVR